MALAPDIFAVVVGYDLWVYLAIALVPIIYLAVQLFLREKVGGAVGKGWGICGSVCISV